MKKILFMVLAAATTFASATEAPQGMTPTLSSTTASTQSQEQSSVSAAMNAGNAQSITFTSPEVSTSNVNSTVNGRQEQVVSGGTNSTVRQEFGSQTIRNTPSVSGQALVSSNDTCMGSASGSVNGPGFGLSLGKTYTDANCVLLKNSRELWNMGMKAAAMALMCKDPDNRDALEVTGYTCPPSHQHNSRTMQASHDVSGN